MSMVTVNEKNIVDRECRNHTDRPMEGPIVGRSKTSKKKKERKYLAEEEFFFLFPLFLFPVPRHSAL